MKTSYPGFLAFLMMIAISGITYAQFNPSLLVAPPAICPGEKVYFVDENYDEANGVHYIVTFGDGGTYASTVPMDTLTGSVIAFHTYQNASLYSYSFIALSADSTEGDTLTGYIFSTVALADSLVYYQIENATMHTGGETCPKEDVYFYIVGGVSHDWYFGDGKTDTGQYVTHSYVDPGHYDAYVISTNGCGYVDTNYTHVFIGDTIHSVAAQLTHIPNKDMHGTDTICPGESVQFSDLTFDPNNSLIYHIDFGDGFQTYDFSGSQVGSNDVLEIHHYTNLGMYIYTFTAKDPAGCLADLVVTDTVYVSNSKSYGFKTASNATDPGNPVCPGQDVMFNAFGGVTFSWHFGDGQSDNQQYPVHAYDAIGEYEAYVLITDGCGLTDSLVTTVYVETTGEGPGAAFHASGDKGQICPGTLVHFSPDNSDPMLTYLWVFENGDTLSGMNVDYTFNSPGNHGVTLLVSDDCGTSSVTDSIWNEQTNITLYVNSSMADHVNDIPISVCPGENINFNVYIDSWGTMSNIEWDFSDGNMAWSESNVSHVFSDTGTYLVTVYFQDIPCGGNLSIDYPIAVYNSDTANAVLYINSQPVDLVNGPPVEACPHTNFNFNFNVAGWSYESHAQWHMGDGTTFDSTNYVNYEYGQLGEYTLTIDFHNIDCVDDFSIEYQIIITDTAVPQVGMYINNQIVDHENGLPAQACPGDPVEFSFYYNGNWNEGAYNSWDFGDGTSIQNNGNPSHSYADTGLYTVTLHFHNFECGGNFSIQYDIDVNNSVVPAFDIWSNDWSICPGDEVSFYSNTNEDVSTYLWQLGNGTTSTAPNPVVSYDTLGYYTIVLGLTNGCNITGYDTTNVNVWSDGEANAGFNFHDRGGSCPGNVMEFYAWGSGDYQWRMGDGTVYNTQEVQHVYADTGAYTVQLVVINGCGNVDTSEQQIHIEYQDWNKPDADIHFYNQFYEDQQMTICIGESIDFGLNGWNFNSVEWQFGDGGFSNATSNVSHTFATEGEFDVFVIAENNCASSSSDTLHLTIDANAQPDAGLMVVPSFEFGGTNELCPNEFAYFFDDNNWNPVNLSYSIWFGDGDSIVDFNTPQDSLVGTLASHRYTQEGEYYAVFSVTNLCGNSITRVDTLVVTSEAATDSMGFYYYENSAQYESGCPGDPVEFFIVGGVSYDWHFGDGQTDTGAVVNHAYDSPGSYDAFVIATNGCGRVDTLYTPATIDTVNLPEAHFDVPVQWACTGEAVQFINHSNNNDEQSLSFYWEFGDGESSTEAEPEHVYSESGQYEINFYVTNGCGTVMSNNYRVIHIEDPVINIGADREICEGDYVVASAGIIPGATYAWSNSATSHQIYIYDEGTYACTVTSNTGCSASDEINVTVAPSPLASASGNQVICLGDSVVLNASGGDSYLWNTFQTTSSISVSPPYNKNYSVKVFLGNCYEFIPVKVTVNQGPQVVINDYENYIWACQGNTVTLQASGADSYDWSTGETTSSIEYLPESPQNVHVYGTDSAGCIGYDDIYVDVNTNVPTADLGPDMAICYGNSANIKMTDWYPEFTWSTGSNEQSIEVSPNANTIYTVTVTNYDGCTASDDIQVSVLPGVTAGIEGPENVCTSDSVVITASGGSSYYWNTGYTTTSITDWPMLPFTYMVTVTGINGCSDQAELHVEVLSLPNADAGTDAQICRGDTASLNAATSASYSWSNGEDTQNIRVSPSVTEMFTLTVNDANGCSATDQVEVKVNQPPDVDAGTDFALCTGTSSVLTATGTAMTYIWNTGETTTSVNILPGVTTTYTLIGFDINACTTADTVVVTVLPETMAFAGDDLTICDGETATLVASGGVSYEWDLVSTDDTLIVSPSTSVTYHVTVTDADGCSGEDSVTVSVNALPVASAGLNDTVCEGDVGTLTATGGVGYEWNNGKVTATIFEGPPTSMVFTVTVTDANSCQGIDSTALIVLAPPVVDAGPDQEIVKGTSAALNATITGGSGTFTYNWLPADSVLDPSLEDATTVTLDASTAFTLQVTDDVTGCMAEDEAIVITTGGALTASASVNPNDICAGKNTTVKVIGSGGATPYTFAWSNGATTASVSVSPVADSTYTVTITDGNTDTATDEVTVTVLSLPAAVADATDTELCKGESTTLIASGGTSYIWNTGEVLDSLIKKPLVNKTYTVTVTGSNGCKATDDVTITVHNLPVADAGANTVICFGSAANLTATGGVTYLWSTNETTDTISANPLSTSVLTVTVTDINGCQNTDQVTITVYSLPVANAGLDVNLCLNDSILLTASGGTSYEWNTGQILAAVTVQPLATSTYTVTVTNVNGCTNSDEVTVTVQPLPTADAGADTTICSGQMLNLMATGGETYNWSNGKTGNTISVSPATTTTYYVTALTSYGCTDNDEVTVAVNPLPVANAGVDVTSCVGDSITLTASGGLMYEWSVGATDATLSSVASTPGIMMFTVTATDVNGCSDADDVQVTVNDLPVIEAGAEATVCEGIAIALQGSILGGAGPFDISWSPDNLLSNYQILNPLANATDTTSFVLQVTDVKGCSAHDTVRINVNARPQANAGADTTICKGVMVELTATGGSTYLWSSGQTSAKISVTPAVTKTYIVDVTENGCINKDTVIVTIAPLPVIGFAGPSMVCAGDSISITATGGIAYAWSTGADIDVIDVAPLASTTYTVTVTNASGCQNVANKTVAVDAIPVVTTGDADTICVGGSYTIKAQGGYFYQWSTGSNTFKTTVTPAVSTIYTVTASSLNGCTASQDFDLTVSPLPETAIEADEDTVCAGAQVILSASGGNLYLWSGGETSPSIAVNPMTDATYTVEATNFSGCKSPASITIIVDDVQVNAGTDQSICIGDSATLTASGLGNFTWSTGATSATIEVAPAVTTLYTVTATNATGCEVKDAVQVKVNEAHAFAGDDVSICAGGEVMLYGSGGVSYLWSTTESIASIAVTPDSTTTYTLAVVDANGCTDTDAVIVSIDTVIAVSAGTDKSICKGSNINLVAGGGTIYAWSTGETTGVITVGPDVTSVFTVTVSDGVCEGTDEVSVAVNDIPVGAIVTSSDTACDGYSVNLLASGGLTYAWSTGETSASIDVIQSVATLYTVTVTDGNGCADVKEKLIHYDLCVTVDEAVAAFNLNIYPNPTRDLVNIEIAGLMSPTSIEIRSMAGQVIYTEKLTQENSLVFNKVIDFSSFAGGLYFFKLMNHDQLIIQKIIIQK